jgi:hypothetical protein
MLAALQHPVRQQVVIIELYLIAFGILVTPSGIVEVLGVVGRVSQGDILFPRSDGTGQLWPLPIFLIDQINHRLYLLFFM